MEFQDLKCDYALYKNFYVVAKTGSFSKAAKALFLSQPTVSYNVKNLEKQLGFKLFFRDSRNVILTPEGKTLFKYIQTAHNALINGEKEIETISSLQKGEVLIGVPINYDTTKVYQWINEFKHNHPKIIVKLYVRSTQELVEMLDSYKIDVMFAFTSSVKNTASSNILVNLPKQELCFAATQEYLDGKDRDDYEFVMPIQRTSLRSHIDLYFSKIQLTPKTNMEAFTADATLQFVKSNYGIGLFFKDHIKDLLDTEQLKQVKFERNIDSINVCFMYKSNFIDYSTKIFVDMIKDQI